MREIDKWRLFVAFWPPPKWAEEVHQVVREWMREHRVNARVIAGENLHATVVFLGEIAATSVGGVAASVAALPPAPNTALEFSELRFAAKQRLWVIEGMARKEWEEYVEICRARLQPWCSQPEQRRFWPHVTVARGGSGGERKREPIIPVWSITAPARPLLVRSLWEEGRRHYVPVSEQKS